MCESEINGERWTSWSNDREEGEKWKMKFKMELRRIKFEIKRVKAEEIEEGERK